MLDIWKFECNQNVRNSIATKILQSVKVLFWIKKAWVKMSAVKRKLKNTKLIQKCQIIRQIEKGMTSKEASEKFGALKNNIHVNEKQR